MYIFYLVILFSIFIFLHFALNSPVMISAHLARNVSPFLINAAVAASSRIGNRYRSLVNAQDLKYVRINRWSFNKRIFYFFYSEQDFCYNLKNICNLFLFCPLKNSQHKSRFLLLFQDLSHNVFYKNEF